MFERLKSSFRKFLEVETPTEAPQNKKEIANLPSFVQPAFRDIAPENRTGKYIDELFGWSFIAIMAIADEVISTPIYLQKKVEGEWIDEDKHLVLDLLKNPNSLQSYAEIIWTIVVFLLAEGEAPILLDNAKNPTMLILLNPERLKIKSGGEDFVTGYEYQRTDGTRTEIAGDLVIMLKLPNLETPFRGSGIMKRIAKTIDIDNYSETFLRNFFYNDATPSGVLETDSKLTVDIIKRLKQQFTQRHQGVKNSHKMAVLEGGLKFNKISNSLGEMGMDKVGEKLRDKILAAFKVPKSVLGIVEDSNRANTEASDIIFYRRAVKPKLIFLSSQLTKYLLPKFGLNEGYRLIFEELDTEDRKLMADIHAIYIDKGVMSVNEVREELGMESIAEGEESPEETPTEDEPKEEPPKDGKKKAVDMLSNILLELSKEGEPKKRFTKKEIEEYHQKKIMFSEDLEAKFRKKLKLYFNSLKNRILSETVSKDILSSGTAEITFSVEAEKQTVASISMPFLEEAILLQASNTATLLALPSAIHSQDEIMNKYLVNTSRMLGDSVTKTTEKRIKRMLRDWAESGEAISVLRNEIKDYFDISQKERVDNIVVTEISRAAGFATQETYKRVGVVGKQWVTAQDERVCEFCGQMDGITIPMKRNFWNKGDVMVGDDDSTLDFDYMGVGSFPLHNRCRCNLIPIFDEAEIPEDPFGYKKDAKKYHEKLLDREIKENKLKERETDLKGKEKEVKEQVKKLKEIKNKWIQTKN
jgi:HK97 family phage portal protein